MDSNSILFHFIHSISMIFDIATWFTDPGFTVATGSSTSTVGRVRRQYCQEGLAEALREKPRPGAPTKLAKAQEQEIAAVVCTTPPPGFARWSVRLLTEEVIRRGICEPVSEERIRIVLRDHDLKPWREKNVVHSTA